MSAAPPYRVQAAQQLCLSNIVEDYAYTFALLKTLRCDVFLAPHGSFFALDEKKLLVEKGARTYPFIDPQSYWRFINATERAYQEQLKEERKKSK